MEKLALSRLLQRLKGVLKIDHLVPDASTLKALVRDLKGTIHFVDLHIINIYTMLFPCMLHVSLKSVLLAEKCAAVHLQHCYYLHPIYFYLSQRLNFSLVAISSLFFAQFHILKQLHVVVLI